MERKPRGSITLHSRTALSSPTERARRSSPEKATPVTQAVWPLKVDPSCQPSPFACHSLSVLSQLPVISRAPVGEKATLVTASLWPVNVCSSRRLTPGADDDSSCCCTRQTFASLSLPPV